MNTVVGMIRNTSRNIRVNFPPHAIFKFKEVWNAPDVQKPCSDITYTATQYIDRQSTP